MHWHFTLFSLDKIRKLLTCHDTTRLFPVTVAKLSTLKNRPRFFRSTLYNRVAGFEVLSQFGRSNWSTMTTVNGALDLCRRGLEALDASQWQSAVTSWQNSRHVLVLDRGVDLRNTNLARRRNPIYSTYTSEHSSSWWQPRQPCENVTEIKLNNKTFVNCV